MTWQKGWRQELASAFVPTRSTAQYLNGWLLTSQNGKHVSSLPVTKLIEMIEETAAEFKQLREVYLPETLLAYISVLKFGGSALTRDFLMECMDLAAVVADEDSDLLELFTKTGRMEELVEAFASASKSLMMITSAKQGTTSRSKKRRVKGWKQEVWTVR